MERTTPFILATLTILVLWYHHAGNATADLAAHRRRAPHWYRHKRDVSIDDMLTAFRRSRITATTPTRAATAQIRDGATTRAAAAA